jgi:hypothetical protein
MRRTLFFPEEAHSLAGEAGKGKKKVFKTQDKTYL